MKFILRAFVRHPRPAATDDDSRRPEQFLQFPARLVGALVAFDRDGEALVQVFLARLPSFARIEHGDRRAEYGWYLVGGGAPCLVLRDVDELDQRTVVVHDYGTNWLEHFTVRQK